MIISRLLIYSSLPALVFILVSCGGFVSDPISQDAMESNLALTCTKSTSTTVRTIFLSRQETCGTKTAVGYFSTLSMCQNSLGPDGCKRATLTTVTTVTGEVVLNKRLQKRCEWHKTFTLTNCRNI